MELTKDSLELATQRDIRDTQALMLAGFELCIDMLGLVIQAQDDGPLSKKEVDALLRRNRETFMDILEHRRALLFLKNDF